MEAFRSSRALLSSGRGGSGVGGVCQGRGGVGRLVSQLRRGDFESQEEEEGEREEKDRIEEYERGRLED